MVTRNETIGIKVARTKGAGSVGAKSEATRLESATTETIRNDSGRNEDIGYEIVVGFEEATNVVDVSIGVEEIESGKGSHAIKQ